MNLKFDKADSALLVMDVQPNIVQRLNNQKEYLAKVQTAVDAAHTQNIPVIYVVVGFRQGFPEVSPANKSFSAIKEQANSGMVEPTPSLKVQDGDIVVTKRRVSAFSGSDLEVVLRSQNIRHLVLAGIATSGVVLSTLREAADKDYQISVLSDLCADFDEQVHKVLIEKVFPRQGDVLDSSEWIKSLKSGQATNV